jgi:hypothetical protein
MKDQPDTVVYQFKLKELNDEFKKFMIERSKKKETITNKLPLKTQTKGRGKGKEYYENIL